MDVLMIYNGFAMYLFNDLLRLLYGFTMDLVRICYGFTMDLLRICYVFSVEIYYGFINDLL